MTSLSNLTSVRDHRCDGVACCIAVSGNYRVLICPQLIYSVHSFRIRLASGIRITKRTVGPIALKGLIES